MIQLIYLEEYDWLIKVFYITKNINTDIILNELDDMDCPADVFYQIADSLEAQYVNTGLTYTDNKKHVTFIVIGEASCPKQFMNTYIHEVGHAACHISTYYDLDPLGEEYQYLVGQIALEMFEVAKQFLCEHCRKLKETNN